MSKRKANAAFDDDDAEQIRSAERALVKQKKTLATKKLAAAKTRETFLIKEIETTAEKLDALKAELASTRVLAQEDDRKAARAAIAEFQSYFEEDYEKDSYKNMTTATFVTVSIRLALCDDASTTFSMPNTSQTAGILKSVNDMVATSWWSNLQGQIGIAKMYSSHGFGEDTGSWKSDNVSAQAWIVKPTGSVPDGWMGEYDYDEEC
jgi:hypothetical protein